MVSLLLVGGVVAAVAHDDGEAGSRVAAAGSPSPAPEFTDDGDDVVAPSVPPSSVVDAAVPAVKAPRGPRLPKVTAPPLPAGVPQPPTCPVTPPAQPLPEKGVWAVPTAGGPARLVLAGDAREPQGISYSPDGRQIVYTRYSYGNHEAGVSMHIAAADGRAERQVAPQYKWATHVAWSPDGRYIGFQQQVEGSHEFATYLLDPVSGAVEELARHASDASFLWSPDGDRVVLTGNTGQAGVWVVEVDGDRTKRKIGDDAVVGVDWSPDGNRLAVGRVGGGVHVFNRDGSGRRLVHPRGIRVAWSPRNAKHLVVDEGGLLFLVDPDAGATQFSYLAVAHSVGWLHDGSALVAGTREAVGLVRIDGCFQPLVPGDGNTLGVRDSSPDSRDLLVARYR